MRLSDRWRTVELNEIKIGIKKNRDAWREQMR